MAAQGAGKLLRQRTHWTLGYMRPPPLLLSFLKLSTPFYCSHFGRAQSTFEGSQVKSVKENAL